jgi:transketolase
MDMPASPAFDPDQTVPPFPQPYCQYTLEHTAAQLRPVVLEMIFQAQSGHPGSSFSCLDVLVHLWFARLRHHPAQHQWPARDRFVMSKGHGAPALYAVLMQAGYIPWEERHTLRKIHSNLQGHPASRYIRGVDVSTGSLGQGLSCAVGMALGHRLDGCQARVYALLGDGECQEGNVWEAVMSAAHHRVSRLTAIVDRNQLQIDGDTEKIKALGDLAAKFSAFGWNTLVCDGHNHDALHAALDQADYWADTTTRPTVIIAETVKGKGVSFMENQAGWHGKAPNAQQYEAARQELLAHLATFK